MLDNLVPLGRILGVEQLAAGQPDADDWQEESYK